MFDAKTLCEYICELEMRVLRIPARSCTVLVFPDAGTACNKNVAQHIFTALQTLHW